jgi:hypothetical protein
LDYVVFLWNGPPPSLRLSFCGTSDPFPVLYAREGPYAILADDDYGSSFTVFGSPV